MEEHERKLRTPQEIKQERRELEDNGIIERKRDALGNAVTRMGKDGKLRGVWVVKRRT
jgi:hypothetical protein